MYKALAYLIFSIVLLQPCQASDNWQTCRVRAHSADLRKQYPTAIKLYEQALAQLPANQENTRICLEAALILDLRQTGRIDESVVHFNSMMQTARVLKERKELLSEALFALQSLIESSDTGAHQKLPYEQGHKYSSVTLSQAIELCELAFPEMLTIERYHTVARTFIALSKKRLAEPWLKRALLFKTNNKIERAKVELELACLQEQLGRPQALQKLTAQLFAKNSKAVALRKLADANIWVANYDKATAQLDEALVALKKQPDVAEQYMVYDTYIYRYMDVLDYKNAEKYLRLQLSILQPFINNHPNYRTKQRITANRLVFLLRQDNRDAEAQALADKELMLQKVHRVPATLSKEADFFLSDKDQEALRKREMRP